MGNGVTDTDEIGSALGRLMGRAEQGVELRQLKISELEAQLSTLKADAKRLRQVTTVLAGLVKEAKAGHWCEVVSSLDRAKDLGSILDHFAAGTSSEIESIRQSVLTCSDEALGELSSSLPVALLAEGLHLDPSSRFPSFKLRNGFLEVRVVKAKREAHIIVRHGATVKVPADLERILEAVRVEDARCFSSTPDLEGFVSKLRASYVVILGADKPRAMPIEDVRRTMEKPAPPRDEFAVLLAAVLREQPRSAIGMTLDHTKSIESGFLLPGFEDRGYFGHITFTSF